MLRQREVKVLCSLSRTGIAGDRAPPVTSLEISSNQMECTQRRVARMKTDLDAASREKRHLLEGMVKRKLYSCRYWNYTKISASSR